MVDEKKIVGTSYIIQLYQEMQALTSTYSVYKNLRSNINSKYNINEENKHKENEIIIDESDKQALKISMENFSFYVNVLIIKFKSLKKIFTDIEGLEKAYENLTKNYIVNIKHAEEFVIEVNKTVMNNETVCEVLINSKDLLDRIMGDDKE